MEEEIRGLSLKARETVTFDTPQRLAMVWMVVFTSGIPFRLIENLEG
jgi:hypothetical protein